MLRTVARTLAWLTLLGILAATISPIDVRPHLTQNPMIERAGAFFLLGLLSCLGYRWSLALALVLLASIGFEAAQLLTVDRHAEIGDALAKAAGGVAGALTGTLVTRLLRPADPRRVT